MIALLDPSLQYHNNIDSNNLGDVVIRKSVERIIGEIFPNHEIIRISTHDYLKVEHYKILRDSDFKIIGGSNLLCGDIIKYNQWKVNSKKSLYFLYPKIKDIILLGTGWWQYQKNPTLITKLFYNQVLNKNFYHSVRDQYTREMLKKTGIKKIINTSCPTLWSLNGFVDELDAKIMDKNVVFTLTDYNQHPIHDSEFIKSLLCYFKQLIFFTQGIRDLDYIKSLEIFKQNKNRFTIIRDLKGFEDCLDKQNTVYIGTRLHGGVCAMQQGIKSLVISIDNRAQEIHKDVNLPVIKRGDQKGLSEWIEGQLCFGEISLNLTNIDKWKAQFKTEKQT